MKLLKEEVGAIGLVLAFFIGSIAITLPSALIHDSETASSVTWAVFAVCNLAIIVSFRLFDRSNTKGDLE